jgi:hypothetical protein
MLRLIKNTAIMDITERKRKNNSKTRLQPGEYKAKISAKNIVKQYL